MTIQPLQISYPDFQMGATIDPQQFDTNNGEIVSKINEVIAIANTIITFENMYPVGSIYMSTSNSNPSTHFGGTWVAWGVGRVPVGVDTSQSEFNAVEKTGGEKTHALTSNEIPSHQHLFDIYTGNTGGNYALGATGEGTKYSAATENTGGGQAHNNLQPYITCYMWKRTA